jgi:RNA polymerase sigma-70 factor (ECF subfamily)
MTNDTGSGTGTTLRVLLEGPADPGAWERFVGRYGPRIYHWCRNWKLQEADAEDITQVVLAKLFQRLRTFHYDPSKGSFRGWLKTVTHHAWADFRDSRRHVALGRGDDRGLATLSESAARADLVQQLREVFDFELLELAKARAQLRVSARDWQIFLDLALGERSGKEVADELGISVHAARMAKCRAQKTLEEEVRILEGGQE